jgi:hypothetical protein
MTTPLEERMPSEDVGSETYRRYRVQAAMAIPYAVGLILGEIAQLIMEHFEDFVVCKTSGQYELHQIKTRETGGRWTLTQLASSGTYGRPLLTMFRKFQVVHDLATTHVLHLQGTVDGNVQTLCDACTSGDVMSVSVALSERLGVDEDECARFLRRLRIEVDVPTEDVIDAAMMARTIYPYTSRLLDSAQVRALYDDIVDTVGRAMEARISEAPDDWLKAVLEGRPTAPAVQRKTLTPESLSDFSNHFAHRVSHRLDNALESIEDCSAMIGKLRRGSANENLVEHAKLLRANAYARHVAYITGGDENEGDLEDIHARLMTRVLQALGEIDVRPASAGRIFSRLAELVQTRPEAIDRIGAFDADPDLLLGVILQLCDECRWSLD